MQINESYTAKGYTPAADVPAAFGVPRTLDGIVIHHWGLPGQTHQGVVDFFCTTGPGETSAHFVVSGGRVDCIVSPLDAAWHCPGKNASHIGIELRPEATPADYLTAAALIAWLRDTYGRPLPLFPGFRLKSWRPCSWSAVK
jgi:N-acetylmuramoyl-L-alanine amidase